MLHGGEEFAHQHVETAVATECDNLARTVERLDAIGLAKGGADGAIVEGADDPLLAALADPVARPERVEPGVDNEHGITFSEVAYRTRHSLRMNAVLAARGIGLLVLHLIPDFALGRDYIEETAIALRLHPIEQRFDGRPHRADNAELGRRAAADHPRPLIHLDDHAFAGQEFRIGIVGAEHQKQIAAHDSVIIGLRSDHADAAHPARVVVRHDIFAFDRMYQWRLEPIGKRTQFLGCTMTSGTAHDHDAPGFVDAEGDLGDLVSGEIAHRLTKRPLIQFML